MTSFEDLGNNTDRLDNPESDGESEHSNHPTDSEQSENKGDSLSLTDFTLGKDKTCWNLHPSCSNVQAGRENIINHLPGVKTLTKLK